MVIDYHPDKANIVADALSQKSMFALKVMNAQLDMQLDGSLLAELKVRPMFLQKIQKLQGEDPELIAKQMLIATGQNYEFEIGSDDSLYFRGRMCVPNNSNLKREILSKAHSSTYSIHPGSTKMYNDLKLNYWWPGMKREISEFVSKCLICQQVKAEHQVLSGLLHPVMIPKWKWERVTMDFVSGLPMSPRKKDVN